MVEGVWPAGRLECCQQGSSYDSSTHARAPEQKVMVARGRGEMRIAAQMT